MRNAPMTKPETNSPADTTSATNPIAMSLPLRRAGGAGRVEGAAPTRWTSPARLGRRSAIAERGRSRVFTEHHVKGSQNMSAIAKLLDKAAKHCSPANQSGLALRLGVTRGAISSWKTSAYPLPAERIAEIARIAQVDPGEWVLLIEAEQATGEAKKAYGSLVKRLGIAALLGLLATPAWASGGGPQVASYAGEMLASTVVAIGIMRSLRGPYPCFGFGFAGCA